MIFVNKAHALTASQFGVLDSLGNIKDVSNIFVFGFNFFYYLAISFVAIGMMYTFFSIAQKMAQSDNENAYEIFAEGMKKLVAVVVIGLLILSLGFIPTLINRMLGTAVKIAIP